MRLLNLLKKILKKVDNMSDEEALFILEQMEELDFGAKEIGSPF